LRKTRQIVEITSPLHLFDGNKMDDDSVFKMYKQDIPALRFIGKKYGDSDRIDGMFSKHWGDWLQNNCFNVLLNQTDKDLKTFYEDGDAYIGLMRYKYGEPFEYCIGIFMPEGTPVPNGYIYHDFQKAALGVCWVHDTEEKVFQQEEKCRQKIEETGHTIANDNEGALWFFERYGNSRFITPDENGKIILDICWYLK
jgi:hypothetical protein